MKEIIYDIVDVFAENKFEGNQLAVFRNCEQLTSEEMLTIAKEINYSEVSFILSNTMKNNGYDVRIFTPEEEVPFAGHPSLGTAFVIFNRLLKKDFEQQVTLNLEAGQIPITKDNSISSLFWMKQIPPIFSKVFDPEEILPVLNLDYDDLDLRYPIQQVSTGLPTVIVPIKNLKSLEKCKLNRERYFEFVKGIDAKLIHLFCPETYHSENDLNVRNFGDYYGVSEEPATGSANGCLAGYLTKYKYFGEEFSIRVEQGREVNRLGHLYLKGKQEKDHISVTVGGKVWMVGEGKLLV